MKFFYGILSLTFLTVSAVVGAGFLSGREIIAFFGADGFLPFLCFAFVLLSVCFYLCYRVGANEKSLSLLNARMFVFPKAVDYAVLVASFISAAGSLAGISSLFSDVFPNVKFPFFSVLTLFLAAAVSEKGIKGVEKISFILVPALVILITLLIFFNGKRDYGHIGGDIPVRAVKTVLYASMNCFINLPALTDGARGKSHAALKISAVLSAALLTGLGIFIASAIKGAGTENSDAPLLFAVGQNPIFFVALIFALITSLFSAYYPLSAFFGEKGKIYGKILLAFGVFSLSLIGVKGIIDGLYPVIGGAGLLYLIKCAKHLVFCRYKKSPAEHNKRKKENTK